jgi:hypothetical protein
MRNPTVTLIAAAAIGAFTGSSNAQETLKAAGAPPPGDHQVMPVADSPAAKEAVAGKPSSAPAKVGKEGVVQPGATTHVKSFKQ